MKFVSLPSKIVSLCPFPLKQQLVSLDGQTLASWTPAHREETGGAGGETSVLKHTFTSHWWKVIFILFIKFLFFSLHRFIPAGKAGGPSHQTHRHKHNGPQFGLTVAEKHAQTTTISVISGNIS